MKSCLEKMGPFSGLTPSEIERVRKIVRGAGDILLRHAGGRLRADYKSPDQPVTDADREADAFLKAELSKAIPEAGWLSEETADSPERLDCRRIWVVDPLDGTGEFVRGLDEYAVSVALVEDGRPILGLIHNPPRNRLWWAAEGKGCFEGDTRCRCPEFALSNPPRALVSRTESAKGYFNGFSGLYDIRPMGSMAYKLGCLASGEADATFTVTRRSEWDVCAGALLALEARFGVTDVLGVSLEFNRKNTRVPGIAAARPEILPALLDHLSSRHRLGSSR